MHFKTFSGPLPRVKFCPFDIMTQAASLTSSTTQKQVQPWVPLSVSPSSPSIYPQLFHPSAWLWLSDRWHLLRSPLTSGTGFHLVRLSATEARKQKWENEKTYRSTSQQGNKRWGLGWQETQVAKAENQNFSKDTHQRTWQKLFCISVQTQNREQRTGFIILLYAYRHSLTHSQPWRIDLSI